MDAVTPALTVQVRLSAAIRAALDERHVTAIPDDERRAAAEILRAFAADLDPATGRKS